MLLYSVNAKPSPLCSDAPLSVNLMHSGQGYFKPLVYRTLEYKFKVPVPDQTNVNNITKIILIFINIGEGVLMTVNGALWY